ncbi:hypothetical protein SRHO_G00158330 [Serrasalmus rhombeus]
MVCAHEQVHKESPNHLQLLPVSPLLHKETELKASLTSILTRTGKGTKSRLADCPSDVEAYSLIIVFHVVKCSHGHNQQPTLLHPLTSQLRFSHVSLLFYFLICFISSVHFVNGDDNLHQPSA